MQSVFSAFVLHMFICAQDTGPKQKPVENKSKEQVLSLFEEEEKKRETKVNVNLRARL